ncbi:MAG: trypsin-like peptidase domain-containing protein [Clostridia bacterium]|nr:trypsin-like peptidase domain-containing protein [Clostridia bacterium]
MKQRLTKVVVLLLSICMLFSFYGCQKALSAYEIAVENGFEGTEEAWLESLKGTNGIDGKDGEIKTVFTPEELYQAAVDNGYEGDFMQFIEDYFSSSVNTQASVENATNRALLSAVTVYAHFATRVSSNYDSYSMGSGVIYKLDKKSGNAYVITNYHVVYSEDSVLDGGISDNIKIAIYGKETDSYFIEATYVGGSANYDIAILKVENSEILKTSEAKAVTVADSNYLKVGSQAIAVGSPTTGKISATQGIVSVDSEYINLQITSSTANTSYRSIRIDAAVNAGNSGGGLYNINGELIGIVNAKTVYEEVENEGFAIPSSLAIAVADNIIWNYTQNGKKTVSKGLMGITVSAHSSKAVYNEELQMVEVIEEVTVDNVNSGSLADGKIKIGDVIEKLEHNGKQINITRMFMVVDYMLCVRPNDVVKVTVKRANATGFEQIVFNFTVTDRYFTTIS